MPYKILAHYDPAADEVILHIPAQMPMTQIIRQLIKLLMQRWNTE